MTRVLRRLRSVIAGLTVAAVGAVVAPPSSAEVLGPSVELDRTAAAPGEAVVATLYGFTASSVTVAVCGNLAKRGSVDCNVIAGTSEAIDRRLPATVTQHVVHAPPAPCPCLVRVTSTGSDEFAVAPLEVIGHPTGPTVGPASGSGVEVHVRATRARAGLVAWFRAALGGPTAYDVAISVRNVGTEAIDSVALTGSAGRSAEDDLVALDLPAIDAIAPGQSWTEVVRATVEAPVLGRYVWRVQAAGSVGGPVVATGSVVHVPLLLYVIAAALMFDLGVVLMRARRRRHDRALVVPSAGDVIDLPALDREWVVDLRSEQTTGDCAVDEPVKVT